MNKTYSAKPNEVEQKWHVLDASKFELGRLAALSANLLRGKHKPQFTPHVDMGDFVIIINAEKVKISGKKETDKMYYSHSGYPGGLKVTSFKEMMEKFPTRAVEKAVKGMLPHSRLGAQQFTKLKVYAGSEHPHQAQQPVEWTNLEVVK
jgi:large subunit ribosomal protein L13